MNPPNKLQPWQEKILKGFKPGSMQIISSGRGVGKSLLSTMAIKRLFDDIYQRPVEDLVLSDNKVHGAKYYCVEPVGGSWLDMEVWCTRTYGEAGELWPVSGEDDFGWPECSRWYMNNRKFWFRNEKDRTLFILKWRS